ncbi:VOC family protein [Paracoccus methylovorus]|uniref:VOC family protein n=1 Tax=Paracoccus methylovorus TaxID=2812658 RepID=A0ABX7JD41_9RHOB|nr:MULTISPECIES: VOC family protein [Paracoccus]QRZ12158.1 VOC family protein [Paracoccus methylovorus]
MPHPVKGVDHIFLLVKDLDASAEAYRRLGFTLSPRGTHSADKGTANYTFVFQEDYAELLGVIADTPSSREKTAMVERDGEGLRAVACRIDDAHAARKALAALGIKASPVGEFSRPLPLPDGSAGTAAFAVSEFAASETPAGLVFMCQQKTRDMVWRPELQSHANGARALAGIVAVSDEPEAMARRFARLYAAGAVTQSEHGVFVTATGAHSASIYCMTPQAAAARYSSDAIAATPQTGFAALQVAVDDLDHARAALGANNIPFHDSPAGIWVEPSLACGMILEFVPE